MTNERDEVKEREERERESEEKSVLLAQEMEKVVGGWEGV